MKRGALQGGVCGASHPAFIRVPSEATFGRSVVKLSDSDWNRPNPELDGQETFQPPVEIHLMAGGREGEAFGAGQRRGTEAAGRRRAGTRQHEVAAVMKRTQR